MKKENDSKLFFYNVIAKFQIFIGFLMMFVSFCCILTGQDGWYIALIIFTIITINGKRMRFKFKRKAGHILFKG